MNASRATLDLSEMKRLGAELDSLRTARVRVGILGGGNRALDPSGSRHPKSGLRRRVGSISRFDEEGNQAEGINNPTLGLIHEFGTKEVTESFPSGEAGPGAVPTFEVVTHRAIPARSWLRMPLMTRLQTKIDEVGRGAWRAIVLRRGLLSALGTLGTVARNLIDKAFETRGWGQWAANAPSTIRRKGSSAPLIDSAQFRHSVNYQVVRR